MQACWGCGESKIFNRIFGVSQFHSLLLPNLHACGVSKVKDPRFFSPRRPNPNFKETENLPNMAKYKAATTKGRM